jgi:prevent-host-death family protein
MKCLNVADLKSSLSKVLDRAEHHGERTLVHRRGKETVAIISVDDLRLFERLLAEAENRADLEAARSSLAESGERIPYEEFRRRQRLANEPKALRSSPKSKK